MKIARGVTGSQRYSGMFCSSSCSLHKIRVLILIGFGYFCPVKGSQLTVKSIYFAILDLPIRNVENQQQIFSLQLLKSINTHFERVLLSGSQNICKILLKFL